MAEPACVFLSYSHADEAWKKRLVAQLGVLERVGKLRIWDDRRISAGADWLPEIEAELAGCAVALLLVSASFLTSGFILEKEVPRLLQRRARGGLRIIPVFVKPCAWQQIDWLNAIQGRPIDGRALSGMRKHNADAVLASLVLEIADLLDTECPGFKPENSRVPLAALVDEAARQVSELHQELLRGHPLDVLKRLYNRVQALEEQFPSRSDVKGLVNDFEQAIAVELQKLQPGKLLSFYDSIRLRRTPSLVLGALVLVAVGAASAKALVAVGAWLWNRLQAVPPSPVLVNCPTQEWVAVWKGKIAGVGDRGTAPPGLQITIGKTTSVLEVAPRDRVTCTSPIAVEVNVEKRLATIWTNGDIPCVDHTQFSSLSFSCEEPADGAANCTGHYAILQPIRVTLTKVGGGPRSPHPEQGGACTPSAPVSNPVAVDPPESVPKRVKDRPGAAADPALPPLAAPTTQSPKEVVTKPAPFSNAMKVDVREPEMIALRRGCFQMGSPPGEPGRWDDEDPQHLVCVGAFSMGRTEVTFAQYDLFAEATGRKKPDDRGWGRGDRPVINVSWQDASAYAAWLAERTSKSYRLPSEAEWEYAARAGAQTPFWTGNCIRTDQANYDGKDDYNACGAKTGLYRRQTLPVAILTPNPWGLHDVAGNVREWVQDCWHANYTGAPNNGSAWFKTGGGDCARRVVRGGGWYSYPWFLRSAYRYSFTANEACDVLGLRLARTP